MKAFVLDISVAASWVFEDEVTDETAGLLERLPQTALLVPSLFWHEARNLLVNGVKRGRTAVDDIFPAIKFLRQLPLIDCGPGTDQDILRLACKYGLSAYDATYLELAVAKDALLLTFDKKLKTAALAEDRAAELPEIEAPH